MTAVTEASAAGTCLGEVRSPAARRCGDDHVANACVCNTVSPTLLRWHEAYYTIDTLASDWEAEQKKQAIQLARTWRSSEVSVLCCGLVDDDALSSVVLIARSHPSCTITARIHSHLGTSRAIDESDDLLAHDKDGRAHPSSSVSEADISAARCDGCPYRGSDLGSHRSSDARSSPRSCSLDGEEIVSRAEKHNNNNYNYDSNNNCNNRNHMVERAPNTVPLCSDGTSALFPRASSIDNLVGLLVLDLRLVEPEGVAHVRWLSVREPWRARGVADALLCHAEQCASQSQARRIEAIAVAAESARLREMGFGCTGTASGRTTQLVKQLVERKDDEPEEMESKLAGVVKEELHDGDVCDAQDTDGVCTHDSSTSAHIDCNHDTHSNSSSNNHSHNHINKRSRSRSMDSSKSCVDANVHTHDDDHHHVNVLASHDSLVTSHEEEVDYAQPTTPEAVESDTVSLSHPIAPCSLVHDNRKPSSLKSATKRSRSVAAVAAKQKAPPSHTVRPSSFSAPPTSTAVTQRWLDYDVPDTPALFRQRVIGFRHAAAEDRKRWRELLLMVCQYNMGGTDTLCSTWNAPCRIVAVRRSDAYLVGLIAMERHGWVNFLACDPDYQHQGIGSFLLFLGMEWLRVRGVTKTFLAPLNTQAANFYKRWGFVRARQSDLRVEESPKASKACMGSAKNRSRGKSVKRKAAVTTDAKKTKRKKKKASSSEDDGIMMRKLDPDVYLLDGGRRLSRYITNYDNTDEIETANSEWYYYFY